ncbi:stage II sporulation protein M [Streptococcus uberis]|nr:stage II sporulation protein M [Streptococcus uberis]MCK1203021.1 stage II sporulation protein M [Streptococcus uberis]
MKLKGIKNQTNYIMVHLLLFFAGIIIGYLFGHIIEDIGEMPFTLRSYQDYFSHNFSSCLLLIFIGFLTYGLLSWIPLVYNAIVFGVAIKLLLQKIYLSTSYFFYSHMVYSKSQQYFYLFI